MLRPAGRRPADGRGTVVGSARVTACRQRRRKKKRLIEAAPFGRLDQMLRTAVQGYGLGGLCPPSQKPGGLSQNRKNMSRKKHNFWATLWPPRFIVLGRLMTFDQGGQTGPPRSNDFLTAPAMTVRRPSNDRPATARRLSDNHPTIMSG